MQIVIAMGGNINDLVSGVDPKTVLNPAEVISKAHQEHHTDECRGTHGECHLVSSVAEAYESRIADLKESFAERSMHYNQTNECRIEDIKRDKKILALTIGSMMIKKKIIKLRFVRWRNILEIWSMWNGLPQQNIM